MAKKFYRELKTHSASFQPRLNLCLDINGNTLMEEKEILERWKKHFQSTLNIYSASEEEDNGILLPEDEMEVPAPSMEEIVDIIKEIENGKAGGEDNITAELVKFGGVELNYIQGSINLYPWRIEPIAEKIIGDCQCGFRRNRSTVDHCFALSQIFEKFHEFSRDLHCLFVDFRQAFDSVDRSRIAPTLVELGIPPKLVRLIVMTLRSTRAKVLIQGRLTAPFEIVSGVKQGDTLSTLVSS
ncbi:uncharacterized protein [Temnothorax nylanderi]|uniref:uncharacterized protein n=1 Tax=Temnothorax nylanderi TaxID=102681 RepID=UPI003A880F47